MLNNFQKKQNSIYKHIVMIVLIFIISTIFFALAIPFLLDQADKEQQWRNDRLIEQGYVK